jgi:hypothetical protein
VIDAGKARGSPLLPGSSAASGSGPGFQRKVFGSIAAMIGKAGGKGSISVFRLASEVSSTPAAYTPTALSVPAPLAPPAGAPTITPLPLACITGEASVAAADSFHQPSVSNPQYQVPTAGTPAANRPRLVAAAAIERTRPSPVPVGAD